MSAMRQHLHKASPIPYGPHENRIPLIVKGSRWIRRREIIEGSNIKADRLTVVDVIERGRAKDQWIVYAKNNNGRRSTLTFKSLLSTYRNEIESPMVRDSSKGGGNGHAKDTPEVSGPQDSNAPAIAEDAGPSVLALEEIVRTLHAIHNSIIRLTNVQVLTAKGFGVNLKDLDKETE